MKAQIGMLVVGEYGSGRIIAMTPRSCIYIDQEVVDRNANKPAGKQHNPEVLEDWASIYLVPEDKPAAVEGSLSEGPEIQPEPDL